MTYYLLRQPETLESLATDKLAAWITLQAKKLMSPISELLQRDTTRADAALSRHIANIRNCLECNMPRMSHDTLLSKTIAELYHLLVENEMNIIGRMVETLFTDRLTSLSLSFDQFKMFRDSFCSKSHMLTGLISLDLNFDRSTFAPHCMGDIEADIIQLLQELHSLKYLTIKIVVTDNVLRCVVKNCTLIEELILDRISDNAINWLTQLCNLRNITLTAPLRSKGVETLLISCENIENISTVFDSNNIVSQALNQLASSDRYAGKLFNVKTYKTINNTLEELRVVFRMCPCIQNLTIRSSYYVLRQNNNNIMAITGLQDLRELTLERYNFYGQVREPLQIIGRNLEHLKLVLVSQIDLNAMIDISQLCPNLQSLTLEVCQFTDQISPSAKKLDIPPFRNLKKLSLDMTSSAYIQERPLDLTLLTSQTLKLMHEPPCFLLSNCQNVEFVEFTRTVMLTEDIMLKILDENPLTYLKELKIVPCNETPQTMPALSPRVLARLARAARAPRVLRQPSARPEVHAAARRRAVFDMNIAGTPALL